MVTIENLYLSYFHMIVLCFPAQFWVLFYWLMVNLWYCFVILFFFGSSLKCCLLLRMRIYYWSCFNLMGFLFICSLGHTLFWDHPSPYLVSPSVSLFLVMPLGVYFDCLVCALLWLREEGCALVCGYKFISPVKNLFDVYEKGNTFKMECNYIRGCNEWGCMEIIRTL